MIHLRSLNALACDVKVYPVKVLPSHTYLEHSPKLRKAQEII